MNAHRNRERVFKTEWFAKAAKKALISDRELCSAIAQVLLGQADDLGGGVFKKRLGRNLYRSIIVARGGRYWVYAYLFAKQNRPNIASDELREFRILASVYSQKTTDEIATDLKLGVIEEICHDENKQI